MAALREVGILEESLVKVSGSLRMRRFQWEPFASREHDYKTMENDGKSPCLVEKTHYFYGYLSTFIDVHYGIYGTYPLVKLT